MSSRSAGTRRCSGLPLGKGHLIATGLKLLASDEHGAPAEAAPEQAWVLDRLLRYGESLLGGGAR